jgi:hypothetical protein
VTCGISSNPKRNLQGYVHAHILEGKSKKMETEMPLPSIACENGQERKH